MASAGAGATTSGAEMSKENAEEDPLCGDGPAASETALIERVVDQEGTKNEPRERVAVARRGRSSGLSSTDPLEQKVPVQQQDAGAAFLDDRANRGGEQDETETDPWGETAPQSSREILIHEKFATLLIFGSVFNLFCELVYTVEAPYSGRFFVIMNVVRHSLAFLSSVKNSFIAARLPTETRAMCLSFFSLTSEVSRAVGCYLFANVLFDPARRGWSAGVPFRFAFLMYFVADIIYIYVFYTYRDPRTALEKDGGAKEKVGAEGGGGGGGEPL